jgi:phage tail sheath protein FI
MPSQFTYPGVYVEELPSGVRTITGVATSIACFVGWAPKGPTDRAVRIGNFTEYVKAFGNIHPKSYLGYAVKHFFTNGGSDAYILRVTPAASGQNANAKCSAGGIDFEASSPGDWAHSYGVKVTPNPPLSDRFKIEVVEYATDRQGTIDESNPQVVETFVNLSSSPDDSRHAKEIVNDVVSGSSLISIKQLGTVSAGGPIPFNNGHVDVPSSIDDLSWLITQIQKITDENGPLDRIDLFNLLCVPGLTGDVKLGDLSSFCEKRRALLLADIVNKEPPTPDGVKPPSLASKKNAAAFYPWLRAPDDLSEGRLADFPTCGFIAGLIARTDATRGVWKAPAGTEATLVGVHSPVIDLTDKENGALNVQGVNCIRRFPIYGTVSWGARTVDGHDEIGSEWKYIPVRRTALFIEETLYRSTKWVVFEPNDEPLWSQIRLNIGSFMNDLFRQGAFQGRSPREAYFVKCDSETTTQSDINRGIVNVVVGFAPLKPAEFVVIKLTQIAGQLEA